MRVTDHRRLARLGGWQVSIRGLRTRRWLATGWLSTCVSLGCLGCVWRRCRLACRRRACESASPGPRCRARGAALLFGLRQLAQVELILHLRAAGVVDPIDDGGVWARPLPFFEAGLNSALAAIRGLRPLAWSESPIPRAGLRARRVFLPD